MSRFPRWRREKRLLERAIKRAQARSFPEHVPAAKDVLVVCGESMQATAKVELGRLLGETATSVRIVNVALSHDLDQLRGFKGDLFVHAEAWKSMSKTALAVLASWNVLERRPRSQYTHLPLPIVVRSS